MFIFIKELIKPLILHVKKSLFISKYRRKNKSNLTYPLNVFSLKNVNVGKYTYGKIKLIDYGKSNSKLNIGNYCSIADNVEFILSGEHDYRIFSTYPFRTIFERYDKETKSKGSIEIKDDVWIGSNCIILSGVSIGRGAVIGAGSIVSKSIPPYSIYVKDRVIKKRFDDETIAKLMKIDYQNMDPYEIIKKNIFIPLNNENLDRIISEVTDHL